MENLNSNNFESAINNSDIALVLFSADWHYRHNEIQKNFEEYSNQSPAHLICYTMDVDTEPDICDMYGIPENRSVILAFQNGEFADTFEADDLESVIEWIEDNE